VKSPSVDTSANDRTVERPEEQRECILSALCTAFNVTTYGGLKHSVK